MKRIALLLPALLLFGKAMHAQECLKPISQTEQSLWGKANFSGLYNEDADQQYLVFPSFWGSQALYIYSRGKKAGTLAVKEKSRRKKGKVADISSNSVSLNVGVDTAERLGNLLHHAVYTSNYLFDRMGLDGIQYFFFDRHNGATSWSPVGSCGRLVKVLDNVINAVQAGDNSQIEAQFPAIDSLTTHFKNNYPEAFFHNVSISLLDEYSGGTDKHIIRLGAGQDEQLSLQFTYPQPYAEELPKQLHDRYSPLLEQLLRYLFLDIDLLHTSTSPLDCGEFDILVDDDKPQSLTRIYDFYTLTVHHDDLTLERLKGLIEEKLKDLTD